MCTATTYYYCQQLLTAILKATFTAPAKNYYWRITLTSKFTATFTASNIYCTKVETATFTAPAKTVLPAHYILHTHCM